MKKIMILGATLTQIPLVESAKKMGYYTIVASIPGQYPAFNYADEKCYVDITDPKAVLDQAHRLKIDGIATCCMDTPVRAVGYVSEKMGLIGLTEHSSLLCNNKYLMKEAFMKNDVNTAKFLRISTEEELTGAFSELDFPLIIKAVDLQASRGIYVAHTQEEAFDGFRNAMKLTHQSFCIVEEFIVGEEFGAQAFVYNGEVLFVLPHGDFTYYTHAAMPIGHFAPLTLPKEISDKAEIEAKKAIAAVGLNNCAVNIDMIYKDGKVYMIELTGRAGATNLCELVSIYYGIDYYKMITLMAMGEDPRKEFAKRNAKTTPNASRFIFSEKSGIIKKIIDHNQPNNNVLEVKFFVKEGDSISKFTDGKDRLGHVIVKSETIEECLALIQNYCNSIEIVL